MSEFLSFFTNQLCSILAASALHQLAGQKCLAAAGFSLW
jgi:hypothetical protein